jgi:hypothetical protein
MSAPSIFTRPARIAAVAPYLWMVLLFLVPFLFVLKISLSQTAIAQPPAGSRQAEARATRTAAGFRKPVNIFPFGVSRNYLEQAIRDLDLPVKVLGNLDGADLVLTLKNHYRRRPDSLRLAESGGLRIEILKSNTVTQVREALGRMYEKERPDENTQSALAEAAEAIKKVRATLRPLEIAPQNAFVRRLQHQMVTDNLLVARSTGKEPRRRLRISPAEDLTE